MNCISVSHDVDFIAAVLSTLEQFFYRFKKACLNKFFIDYYTFNFENIFNVDLIVIS